jgi:hypothetical protein
MVFVGLRHRLAGRSPAELVRAASLRVWPLSSMTRAYYELRFWEPVWRDVINRRARVGFEPLDTVQERVVASLRSEGIAVLHIDELLRERGAYARLNAAAQAVLDRPAVQAQIKAGLSVGARGKYFQVRAYHDHPRLDIDDPLMALAVAPRVLAVVNAYFGFLCRLKSFELWVNLPHASSKPAGSQRWHRDYEDRNLLKIFLYLSDVDEGTGPLSFVRTSQIGGALGRIFPRRPPHGAVPAHGEVEREVPPDLIETCTVPAGTVVLCDTTGLHKGGLCERSHRVAFTATFASHGAIDRDRYDVPASVRSRSLSPAALHALGLGRSSKVDLFSVSRRHAR